jgi:hypothetical protein
LNGGPNRVCVKSEDKRPCSCRFALSAWLLVLFAILATTARAQTSASLPAAWAHWKYFRSINLSATVSERLVFVRVPEEIYGLSANRLADLRIMDDRGAEIPYVLSVPRGVQSTVERPCTIRESSFVPGKYTQIICDAGENSGFHNAVRISTSDENFMAWVEIAVSDDARLWRIVNERAPIYEFAGRDLNGLRTIHYGDTNARYLRARIFLGDAKFPVGGVMVLRQVTQPRESAPIVATIQPDSLRVAGESIWKADLRSSHLPVDEVRFDTAQPEFSRRVYAEASSDGVDWYPCGGGDIYRFRQGDTKREGLSVSLSDQWPRYLRIHVVNGNDAPLEKLSFTLYMTARELVFRQEPGRNYSLLYGQSEAKPPQYDIAQTVHPEQMRAAQPALGVGAEETNSAWSDPRPWTDRHTAVLWIAAILAALLLALSALRSLRAPGSWR